MEERATEEMTAAGRTEAATEEMTAAERAEAERGMEEMTEAEREETQRVTPGPGFPTTNNICICALAPSSSRCSVRHTERESIINLRQQLGVQNSWRNERGMSLDCRFSRTRRSKPGSHSAARLEPALHSAARLIIKMVSNHTP